MQKILGYMRKAIDEYNMIEDGDKIAVALSGGKDSFTLLLGLKNLQKFYPKKFDIIGVTINPGFEFFDSSLIKNFCDKLDVPFFEEHSHAQEIVFEIRKEKNPCSLCANLRRGIINSVAQREGCIGTFSPKSYMNKSEITLIRPLIYAPEKYIQNFVKRNNIEVMPKACPMDGNSKREDMKKLIQSFYKDLPHIRSNLYGAIKRAGLDGWKNNK